MRWRNNTVQTPIPLTTSRPSTSTLPSPAAAYWPAVVSSWSIFLLGWGGLFAVMIIRRWGRLPALFWSQVGMFLLLIPRLIHYHLTAARGCFPPGLHSCTQFTYIHRYGSINRTPLFSYSLAVMRCLNGLFGTAPQVTVRINILPCNHMRTLIIGSLCRDRSLPFPHPSTKGSLSFPEQLQF